MKVMQEEKRKKEDEFIIDCVFNQLSRIYSVIAWDKYRKKKKKMFVHPQPDPNPKHFKTKPICSGADIREQLGKKIPGSFPHTISLRQLYGKNIFWSF